MAFSKKKMENSMPLIGSEFPTLKVTTTQGSLNLPEDMKGKWFVLFSHIKWIDWIREREETYECFDWWFCHQKL